MQQIGLILERLEELRFLTPSDTQVLRVPRQRCGLVRDLGTIGGLSFYDFIEQTLYGIRSHRQAGTASLIFSGGGDVLVERHFLTDAFEVVVNGEKQALKAGQSPGEYLFAMNRDAFREAVLVDGRDFIVPKGREALQNYLTDLLLEGPTALRPAPGTETEDLESVRQRRIALEKQLATLPAPDRNIALPTPEPPNMDEFLQALEQTREIERRLLERRLRLNEEARILSQDAALPAGANAGVILAELEKKASHLEEMDGALKALKRASQQGPAFAVKAAVIITLMISAGAAAIGQILEEVLLTRTAFFLAGLAVVGTIAIWFMRLNRLIKTTSEAKALRLKRNQLRDQAAKLCLRVGAVGAEDLSPDSIRTLIDRTSRRDLRRMLKEAILPFVDSEQELKCVRRLHRALETPLTEAAEARDRDMPAVPLVRVTRSALGMLSQWTRAVQESCEEAVSARQQLMREQVERELLEQSLEKLRATERTLELVHKKAIQPESEPAHRAARHLNQVFVPLLHRYLGHDAPRSFDADLMPQFAGEPSSCVNSFIALIVRLFNPAQARRQVRPVGSVVMDPGLAVGCELESPLAQLLAHSPMCGHVTLTHSRQELEEAFLRAAALDVGTTMGMANVEELADLEARGLYSPHDHTSPAPSTSHLLL